MDKAYYDDLDRAAVPYNHSAFTLLLLLSQLFGSVFVILLLVWVLHYMGGLGWTGNHDLQFDWHPLLMGLGLIFFAGESLLVYRTFRNRTKVVLKSAHGILHLIAFACAVIGLVAVFEAHRTAKFANLYSIHSWVGLTTVILFGLQLTAGFLCFMFPKASQELRKFYMPIHVYFGIVAFGLAIVAMVSGVTEQNLFKSASANASRVAFSYSRLLPETGVGNVVALFGVLFAIVTTLVVTWPDFKRQPLPEEIELPLTQTSMTSSIH